jgi:hypothetical protein
MAHNDWRSRSCERSEQFVRSPARRARFLFSESRARPRERINGAKRNVSREGKDRAPQAQRRGAEWLRLVIRRGWADRMRDRHGMLTGIILSGSELPASCTAARTLASLYCRLDLSERAACPDATGTEDLATVPCY